MAALRTTTLASPLKKLESRRIAARWVTKWVTLEDDTLSYYKTEGQPGPKDAAAKTFDLTTCGFYADQGFLKFEVRTLLPISAAHLVWKIWRRSFTLPF